jgi:nitroreductase
MPPSFIDALRWRYATKKFDPKKKLTDTQLSELLECLRLSASSFGLQPWEFLVIKDPALRAALKPVSWNQSQIVDASHLIALCAKKEMTPAHVHAHVLEIAKENGQPYETFKPYEDRMLQYLKAMSAEQVSEWMRRQVYIALGFLLSACAAMQIDSCPMEGFDKAKVNEILGLDKRGLQIVLMCPVGYRAADDVFMKQRKTRFPKEQVVRVLE